MSSLQFVCAALSLISVVHSSGDPNSTIKTWNTTIRDPDLPDHAIPLSIYYPSNTEQKYPVMVFYHGWECDNTWYNFVWQKLVPLGMIVVLPNDYLSANDTNETLCALSQRYTLEWLTQNCNTDPKCRLHGIVGTQSIAAGHSMGGGTSLLSVSSKYALNHHHFVSHFDAAFIFSGCGHNQDIEDAVRSIDIPIFLFTASHDCMCPPERTATKYYGTIPNTTCKVMADIKNGSHCGFMNAPSVHEDACKVFDSVSCPFHDHDNIELTMQLEIVMVYLEMFVDATMRGGIKKQEMKKIEKKLESDKDSGVMEEYAMSC